MKDINAETTQRLEIIKHKDCKVYYKKRYIDTFPSVKDAAMFAAETYGCKESMLRKHMKHRDVVLVRCND